MGEIGRAVLETDVVSEPTMTVSPGGFIRPVVRLGWMLWGRGWITLQLKQRTPTLLAPRPYSLGSAGICAPRPYPLGSAGICARRPYGSAATPSKRPRN